MTAAPTVSNLNYRPRIQLVNAMAWAQERLGFDLGDFDPDRIIAIAQRETGLTDLGDLTFRPAFDRIASELQANHDLTPLARVILRQTFLHAVRERLFLRRWIDEHPAIFRTPVERPIFVLGFPRTGTTVLQNLLSLDPRRRGVEFWELSQPAPTLEDRDLDRQHRQRRTGWVLQAAYQLAPEMGEVHFIDVTTVEECWPLFVPSFAVMNWDLQTGMAGWGDWLMSEWDMAGPYREYRERLQVICERHPAEQLVLKCPEHLFFVDALLEVFPDACIVQTHRDPYATIGSYCSLISMQWRNLYGHIDRARIGEHMERRLHDGVSRAMAAREHADPARFFDVRFESLVEDPAAVVDAIAAHFDLDLEPGHAQAVARYLANERSDARGRHRYDPADYGLTREAVYARYTDYIDRFGIQTR
ncbi:MAG: sulfotransferase [Myxococcota bacterium]